MVGAGRVDESVLSAFTLVQMKPPSMEWANGNIYTHPLPHTPLSAGFNVTNSKSMALNEVSLNMQIYVAGKCKTFNHCA